MSNHGNTKDRKIEKPGMIAEVIGGCGNFMLVINGNLYADGMKFGSIQSAKRSAISYWERRIK